MTEMGGTKLEVDDTQLDEFRYPKPNICADEQKSYQVMRAELEFRHQLPRFEDEYVTGPYRSPLETVTFSTEVGLSLLKFFKALGVLRTGPLFGTRNHKEGNLHPTPIVQNGSVTFLNQHGPFDICEEYLLGYSEAVRHFVPGFDWYGHWVIHPEGHIGTAEWRLEILNKFREKNLLRLGLVIMFFSCTYEENDLLFSTRAYTLTNGEIQEVEIMQT